MSRTDQAGYPLAWHRFLYRFLLWIAALLHLLQAAWMMVGGVYQGADIQSAVYTALPALQYIDYARAACLVISAPLLVLAAVQLKKQHKKGLALLTWGWLLAAGGNLSGMLLRFIISGLPPLNLSEISQVLLQAILVVICVIYYRRRPDLFGGTKEVSAHES